MGKTDIHAAPSRRLLPDEQDYLLGQAEHHRRMAETTQDFGTRSTHQQFHRLYAARLATLAIGKND